MVELLDLSVKECKYEFLDEQDNHRATDGKRGGYKCVRDTIKERLETSDRGGASSWVELSETR